MLIQLRSKKIDYLESLILLSNNVEKIITISFSEWFAANGFDNQKAYS
jgi:hypothetical protein